MLLSAILIAYLVVPVLSGGAQSRYEPSSPQFPIIKEEGKGIEHPASTFKPLHNDLAQLDKLPDELVLNIFDQIDPPYKSRYRQLLAEHTMPPTARQFSSTSRKFRRIGINRFKERVSPAYLSDENVYTACGKTTLLLNREERRLYYTPLPIPGVHYWDAMQKCMDNIRWAVADDIKPVLVVDEALWTAPPPTPQQTRDVLFMMRFFLWRGIYFKHVSVTCGLKRPELLLFFCQCADDIEAEDKYILGFPVLREADLQHKIIFHDTS